MNIINLLNLIRDQIDYSTYDQITSDFMINCFSEERSKLRITKSEREKAVNKYISEALYKDSQGTGIYSTGHTALMVQGFRPEAENKNIQAVDLSGPVMSLWKDRRPTDCYIIDSIALYKALKKQEDLEYRLLLDGHLYNAKYIAEMTACIADNKDAYIRCDIVKNGALILQQNSNVAVILPIVGDGCHASKNINAKDFFSLLTEIEKSYTKTA